MTEFEKRIGYSFNNPDFLNHALTHSSYANEHHISDNERMEFLGDAVLNLIVSENLFNKLSGDSEGDLSKIRAALVCEQGLFELSKKIGLAQEIKLGHGEEMTGGRDRPSVVSDAFEALLAGIFLDSDFETARAWLLKLMDSELSKVDTDSLGDFKSMLQEHTQKGGRGKVTYRITKESGPDHSKMFECEVLIDGKAAATGKGRSKKDAEQDAAKNALDIL